MPANATYDVVIVGAGIAGAIMAKELGTQGKRVLILESGPLDRDNRKAFHGTYLAATGKLPETPYPPYADDPASEAAPRATTAMTFGWPTLNDKDRPKRIAALNEKSYLTYQASSDLPFLSTYERLAGGTTWHWLGTCLRLVPNDFRMKSAYGVLVDWPLDIADLFDDYARAEDEIGVSADIADQRALQPYLGEQFPPGYWSAPTEVVLPEVWFLSHWRTRACRRRNTSLKRSSRSCGRSMSWYRRGALLLRPCARSA